MLSYYEMYGKFYSHLTSDDLAHEEWRRAIIDGKESNRYIVSSCGRFADLRPKRTYRDFGRWYEAPGFGKCQMLNVSNKNNIGKKNAADDYLIVNLEKTHQAHVVVARTFIGNIPNGYTVDHVVEGNAYDNRAGNLQLLSSYDNRLKKAIVNSYKSGIPVGVIWIERSRKWRVGAPRDVFSTKIHVAYFDQLEPAVVCAAIIFRRYCQCDSEKIRDMLLKSYDDLADYELTAAERADVDAKITAFEDRNAGIIKGIGALDNVRVKGEAICTR